MTRLQKKTLRLKSTPKTAPKGPLALRWSCWTDKGRKRKNNEDSFLCVRYDTMDLNRLGKFGKASLGEMDFVFAVSDGMGGAMAGEFASKIAVEKITTMLPGAFPYATSANHARQGDSLVELYRQIHRALANLGQCYEECRGMETTMSLCLFSGRELHFAHVGDSRIYHLPPGTGTLRQITQDDTYVAWMLRQGRISEWEARTHPRRNVLQKALGSDNIYVDPQTGFQKLQKGDLFILCSDGLSEGLYPHQMMDILRQESPADPFQNPARRLVQASVEADGKDNVTALVVEVE